jgi:hypothetical protein
MTAIPPALTGDMPPSFFLLRLNRAITARSSGSEHR